MTSHVRLSADLVTVSKLELVESHFRRAPTYLPQLDPVRLDSEWQLLVIVSTDGRRSSKTSTGLLNLTESVFVWNASGSHMIAKVNTRDVAYTP